MAMARLRATGSEAGRGVGATGVTPTMGVVVAVPGRRQLDLPPRSLVLEWHLPSTGFRLSVVPQIRRWWRTVAKPPTDLHQTKPLTESAFCATWNQPMLDTAHTQAMPP